MIFFIELIVNSGLTQESLIALCAIYDRAKLIEIDPDKFLDQFSKIANIEASKILTDFIKRNDNDKSLEAFGFSIKYLENDFELIPPWSKK